jgi:DNA-binding MarR family transcriptional regulator
MTTEEATRLIHAIRLLDSEMPIPQAHVLFIVAGAGSEGITMANLCRKAQIGQASCSRYVAALGKQGRHREQGLGLVQATEDPLERRRKIVTLTTKGQGFINKVTTRR